ncbi:HAD-IA family hydrolase [Marinobacter confluentis]|uniref:HAD-IA family hydrolase n=1 Tax=Marinobacter confluentis TaxID=1697557 RepID=UPI001CD967C3|nr:HAD-IA family hydrolase [Marinobacter confluentis]
MNHKPSAVLFDLDGTLIDTAPDFIRCLNQLRQTRSLDPLPPEFIRQSVSDGARAMVRIGFGIEQHQPGYAELRAEFLDLYEIGVAVETTLFDGMDEILLSLEARQIPWGIVTNKPVRFAAPLIQALGLGKRCSTLICPDHVANTKPDPEALFLACNETQATPETAIYVGDHKRDIDAGRNAGMKTIAVRYGYIEQPETVDSWQADHIADTVNDLAKLLQ